ncbi:MAG: indole-3-glycerol phosphate synthase TrpC [Trueperaceae bacterium]
MSSDAAPASGSLAARPAPLAPALLARVPGVIGEIGRARAADMADAVASRAPDVPDVPIAGAAASGLREAIGGRAERGLPPAVVAEIKRASPSLGAIADLDPLATARAYAAAGAAAVSVLTEPHRFGGTLAHLRVVAAAVPLPALRKDFVVHPLQVEEAAHAGARAVLLIVGLLGEAVGPYLRYARSLGLDALVEVHDEAELDAAVAAGARLIGVNNRDLRSLEIDPAVAPRLIQAGRRLAPGAAFVAESGYRDGAAVARLAGIADAVLVGSHLAGSGDPGGALRAFLAAARRPSERC